MQWIYGNRITFVDVDVAKSCTLPLQTSDVSCKGESGRSEKEILMKRKIENKRKSAKISGVAHASWSTKIKAGTLKTSFICIDLLFVQYGWINNTRFECHSMYVCSLKNRIFKWFFIISIPNFWNWMYAALF